MAACVGVVLPLMVLCFTGMTTWVFAMDNTNVHSPLDNVFPQADQESMSVSETTLQSRSDYPDFEDLSSFFDFDIGPRHPNDPRPAESSSLPMNDKNKYYFYEADYEDDQTSSPTSRLNKDQLVVTPGTHYRPGETPAAQNPQLLNQAIVGPYQVAVVDSKSPLLTSLGLDSNHLEMLAATSRRFSANSTANMLPSESIPPATYAEYPRSNYPPSSSGHPPGPSYDPPSSSYDPPRSSSHDTPRSSSYDPPRSASYDPPKYQSHSSGYEYNRPKDHPAPSSQGSYGSGPTRSSVSYQPPQGSGYHGSTYPAATAKSEPWRPKTAGPTSHTDWDDKDSRRPDWQQTGSYPPHPAPVAHSHTVGYQKPYASDRPRQQSYGGVKPDSSTSSGSVYGSSSGYGSQAEGHHGGTYQSSSPSTAKAPYRAGYASYTASSSSYHHPEPAPAPGKPGITIRFKAKAPGSGHGLSIPLNFNPLDVVKRLLPSLNPLKDRKVTIGITIENKKEGHHY